MEIKTKTLMTSIVAGVLVQVAVSLKNSAEQYSDFPLKIISGLFAQMLFVVGWMMFAYSICGAASKKCILPFVSAILVVMSVFYMKSMKGSGNKYIPLLFPLGWLGIAYAIGKKKLPLSNFAYLGSLMAVLSMTKVLPYQRKHCIVDGLGMNLFSSAWILLAIANSTTKV